jgi:hypothetical protein
MESLMVVVFLIIRETGFFGDLPAVVFVISIQFSGKIVILPEKIIMARLIAGKFGYTQPLKGIFTVSVSA